MSTLEKRIEQILYSNDSAAIAEEVIDLLIQTRGPGALEEAIDLLYPKLDHCGASKAQYVAGREKVLLGEGEEARL